MYIYRESKKKLIRTCKYIYTYIHIYMCVHVGMYMLLDWVAVQNALQIFKSPHLEQPEYKDRAMPLTKPGLSSSSMKGST